MNATAQIAALLAAVVYIAASPTELIFFNRPWARKFLHVEADNLADVRMWAFVIGFRNLLVGGIALVGLAVLRMGDPVVGEAVVVTACVYMLLASLAMGTADALGFWRPRGGSVVGTIASSVAPLVALVAWAL